MSARRIRASWWVDFRFRGVRYRKRSPHNTKAAAREYENTLRLALAAGEDPFAESTAVAVPMVPTFTEFAGDWFARYVCANNKLSERRSKRMILQRHLLPAFGKRNVDEVDSARVEAYKAAKLAEGLTAKTVNNQLAVLGKMLRTAHEWNVLQSLPRIRLLRTAQPKTDFLTPLESHTLVSDTSEPEWNAMVRLGLRTGMRVGELRGLDWSDVDLGRKVIAVRRSADRVHIDTTKTYRTRHIPMTDDVSEMLTNLPARSGFVFHRENGSPVAESTSTSAIHRICDSIGLRRIGWHVLRHTFASRLVSEGVPLNEVMRLMGHSCITTTMRYAHFAPNKLHESIRVLQAAERRALAQDFGQPVGNAVPEAAPEPIVV